MANSFKENENELLKTFLDNTVFQPRFNSNVDIPYEDRFLHVRPCPKDGGMNIELIVRPDCNQKCEYCYIAKYGHKSYPIEERVSNEEILKNLDSFLDYIYNDREYFVGDWELFAGDMFYDGLYFDLLDVFYKYISVEYEKHTNLYLDPHIHIFAPINFLTLLSITFPFHTTL